MNISRLLSASALAGSLVMIPSVAWAQGMTPAQCADPQNAGAPECRDETQKDEVIVVTGSRIARPNLDTTQPVTSITAEALTNSSELSLGDALNQLPALRATYSQANSTRFIGTAGLNQLDLRGLGTDRTLVLVNGRRHVSAVPGSYIVDVNTIPNALLEGVDVVTGGNSAVYGSDAIAGVVNFKLKKDYEGLDIRAQGGISSRGDRGNYLISAVGGKNFADGRGNIAVSAEYAKSNTLLFEDRPDQTGAFSGTPGFYTVQYTANETPAGDGISDTRFFGSHPGGTFGNISLGGTVNTTCPAASADPLVTARRGAVCTGELSPTGGRLSDNYVFLADGSLVRDDPAIDLRAQGGGRFGGLTASGVEGAMLLPGLQRINTNMLFNFEFSPAVEFFAEGKYVHVTANQTSTQPTFVNSTLNPTFFLDNPFLSEAAKTTIRTIQGYAPTNNTGSFTMFRFNNDIGTRAEDHKRDTYRLVGGLRGQLADSGNITYEIAANWGRTTTYYETGGNVDIAKFNKAKDAVRNTAGQIVCRVNADASTTNDDAACVPLNLFGQNNSSQAARDYVLYTSSRNQWAEELDLTAYVAGDTGGFFNLPAGPIGFSLGGEYRREDAYSDYDDYTQSGATFLNSISAFNPKAVSVKEGFGELRIPLLKDMLVRELTIEGSARYSKYSSMKDGIWAWNIGGIFAPVRDLRFRATYARSVRAPNLSDLYATASQTFANGFVDPCSQSQINLNPNRVRNCAAAGVPTSITLPDGTVRPWENTLTSGLSGINSGNAGLKPEVGKSLTLGAVFEPTFLRGFSLTVDYYNIEVTNVIAGLSGQAIVNRCYDDPVGLSNPFCAATFRRTSSNALINGTFAGQSGVRYTGYPDFDLLALGATVTPGFLNTPFNYAKFKTSGIDADLSYRTKIGDWSIGVRGLVSWLKDREQFTFITAPNQSTRVHGTLGDPEWKGRASLNVSNGVIDFGYDLNYIGRMTIGTWETQFSWQGRAPQNADAFPFKWYSPQYTHDIQLGIRANEQFRIYMGIDNVFDTLPPYGLTGTGAGGGIYGVIGRSFYMGARIKM